MTKIVHTKDLDVFFFPRLDEVANAIKAQPQHMLAVMFSESGCFATAHNDNPKNLPPEKRYNASGLIQFMPDTLRGLGWSAGHAAFRKLSATEQLSYVERYYRPYVGHLGTIAGLYVATFLPALLRHCGNPSFVLTAKNGPLGWAYAPNAAFDANLDFAITVGELESAVKRNARGPRWNEILARLEGGDREQETEGEAIDLRTTLGIQRALASLGIDPGPLDGIPGPKTSAAVEKFQAANPPLVVDGIVGPKTGAALAEALSKTS